MNPKMKKTLNEMIDDLTRIVSYLDTKKLSQGLNPYDIRMMKNTINKIKMLNDVKQLREKLNLLETMKSSQGLNFDEKEMYKTTKKELEILEIKSGIKEEIPRKYQLVSQ